MSIMNPKIDLIFKKLFGSEENKDILKSLINAVLPANQQLATIVLKNPYNVSDYAEGKLSILDIKAEDENGVLYDIEMQIRGSDFYGRRTLYYWAKMFGSQLDYINELPTQEEQMAEMEKLAKLEKQKKLKYSGLKKCIVISLMDFTFFADQRYYRCFMLKDGLTNEIHQDLDYLDLYFIELQKFTGELGSAKTMLERWITFLNNAHSYTKENLPKELAEIKEINQANSRLNVMYLVGKEKIYYEGQQKFWLDQTSIMAEMMDKMENAVKKAAEESMEKGIEKGATQKQIEVAKNFKNLGLSNEDIAKGTGLSIEEIEKL
jgi:predicted transposase/invertase (TIGR01784 family)